MSLSIQNVNKQNKCGVYHNQVLWEKLLKRVESGGNWLFDNLISIWKLVVEFFSLQGGSALSPVNSRVMKGMSDVNNTSTSTSLTHPRKNGLVLHFLGVQISTYVICAYVSEHRLHRDEKVVP